MKTQRLGGKEMRHVLVFDKGDEVIEHLLAFARREQLEAATFTRIGAFSDVTLGFFEREQKEYKKIPLAEQVEVLTLAGDIALKDGEPLVHAHIVVGKADGTAWGGHLLGWPRLADARARPRRIARRVTPHARRGNRTAADRDRIPDDDRKRGKP